jgi:tetratricopeptide (TPR) repeat protein
MRNTTLAAIAVAALAIAGGAEAQTVDRVAIQTTDGIAAAIDLERQVESAIAEARWSDAASMLRAASDLRPPSDPVALSNLSSAGALYGTIGQFDEAKGVFVELVDRATQQDEFATVANAWIDAAHAAAALGDSRSAVEYYERAQHFVTSSLLTSQEAQALNDRLEKSSALVARR